MRLSALHRKPAVEVTRIDDRTDLGREDEPRFAGPYFGAVPVNSIVERFAVPDLRCAQHLTRLSLAPAFEGRKRYPRQWPSGFRGVTLDGLSQEQTDAQNNR